MGVDHQYQFGALKSPLRQNDRLTSHLGRIGTLPASQKDVQRVEIGVAARGSHQLDSGDGR
jgi:hypothetical protein